MYVMAPYALTYDTFGLKFLSLEKKSHVCCHRGAIIPHVERFTFCVII